MRAQGAAGFFVRQRYSDPMRPRTNLGAEALEASSSLKTTG